MEREKSGPIFSHPEPTSFSKDFSGIERFSYDLEMKTREQNRNNKRTEIERFDWFIERTDKRVWLFIG